MTRIGFTYNQKPEPEAMLDAAGDGEGEQSDEEPPSRAGMRGRLDLGEAELSPT
jgi:hypothetical protein